MGVDICWSTLRDDRAFEFTLRLVLPIFGT
jgi:hypothetical protein